MCCSVLLGPICPQTNSVSLLTKAVAKMCWQQLFYSPLGPPLSGEHIKSTCGCPASVGSCQALLCPGRATVGAVVQGARAEGTLTLHSVHQACGSPTPGWEPAQWGVDGAPVPAGPAVLPGAVWEALHGGMHSSLQLFAFLLHVGRVLCAFLSRAGIPRVSASFLRGEFPRESPASLASWSPR